MSWVPVVRRAILASLQAAEAHVRGSLAVGCAYRPGSAVGDGLSYVGQRDPAIEY